MTDAAAQNELLPSEHIITIVKLCNNFNIVKTQGLLNTCFSTHLYVH